MRYVAKRLSLGAIPARYEWLRGLVTISAGLIARGAPVFEGALRAARVAYHPSKVKPILSVTW
jgi:hypothetical protein